MWALKTIRGENTELSRGGGWPRNVIIHGPRFLYVEQKMLRGKFGSFDCI